MNSRGMVSITGMVSDLAAHILPNLLDLIPTCSGEDAFRALTAIQANCQFYNYTLFRSDPVPEPSPQADTIENNYYIIDHVGNLNTGNVNIHGNQISE